VGLPQHGHSYAIWDPHFGQSILLKKNEVGPYEVISKESKILINLLHPLSI
jgi:hypothetical protein